MEQIAVLPSTIAVHSFQIDAYHQWGPFLHACYSLVYQVRTSVISMRPRRITGGSCRATTIGITISNSVMHGSGKKHLQSSINRASIYITLVILIWSVAMGHCFLFVSALAYVVSYTVPVYTCQLWRGRKSGGFTVTDDSLKYTFAIRRMTQYDNMIHWTLTLDTL